MQEDFQGLIAERDAALSQTKNLLDNLESKQAEEKVCTRSNPFAVQLKNQEDVGSVCESKVVIITSNRFQSRFSYGIADEACTGNDTSQRANAIKGRGMEAGEGKDGQHCQGS